MVGSAPRVLILAAGDGVRQGQLWPKPFSLIAQRPLIKHLEDAVLEVFNEPPKIILRLGDERWAEWWKIRDPIYQERREPSERIRRIRDDCDRIVLLGDTLWFPRTADVLAAFNESAQSWVPEDAGAAAVATVLKTDVGVGIGADDDNRTGRLTQNVELDAGMYFLRAGFKGDPSCAGPIFDWLAAHAGLMRIPITGDFVDVGTPAGLVEAEQRYLAGNAAPSRFFSEFK